jgi:exosortase
MTPAAHTADAAADRQAAASDPPPRASSLLLWLVIIELGVLFAPTVRFLFERWTMSVWHNAHGLFVAPIAAWLAWDELRRDAKTPVKGSAWGFAFVVPALSLQAIDAGLHTELLSAIALIMLIPGLALLVLGANKTRRIAFPLFFLVFALPIPLGMTETLHLVLRHLTVAATSAILPIIGITVFVEDTTLHLTNGALTVADACSGFSTLYAALAVATFAAYTAHSAFRRVLVLTLAAPVAILSNIARILLLVALVQGWGPDVLHTALHPLSGLLTFAISLPLIFWLGGPVESGEPVVRNTALAG